MGDICCLEEREVEESIDHDITLDKSIQQVIDNAFAQTGNDPNDVLTDKKDLQVVVRYIRDLDYIIDDLDEEIANNIWKKQEDGVVIDDVVDWLKTAIKTHEGNVKALLTKASRVLISVQQLPGYNEQKVNPAAIEVALAHICKKLNLPEAEWPGLDRIQSIQRDLVRRRDSSIPAEMLAAKDSLTSTEAEDAFIVLLTSVYANYFRCRNRLTP
eukprot:gnl/MRDRNA2_/MRDRNA2_131632_c0_seq1.p1 gnl/MRDRNA2_/MRDRNA2_131632_c0~~gnl/MRDRNA2_/MRDRNA2_131632_c0_seq1.p1  ORF type:complete len:214 (-),score=43.45 gnl/MRDRNA2_/MRDRNA2_131632_c0_seq1:74-715(-)